MSDLGMGDLGKKTLRSAEDFQRTAESCRYNVNGVCILSDCPCQAAADGHMICSSFKNSD